MTEGEENIIIKGVLLEAISRDFSEELSNNKEVSVSPRFKRQMMAMMNNPNKWAERHKRDYRRRFVKVVATIVLTCSLPFGVLTVASPTVRAAVIDWVVEWYESSIIYKFFGESDSTKLPLYEVIDLPFDYTRIGIPQELPNNTEIIYENSDGEILRFEYMRVEEGSAIIIDAENMEVTEIGVNGCPGHLYISVDPEQSNCITWYDNGAKMQFTSTWNCDVYTSNSDTYVNFEKVSTGVYYIRLKSHPERYLTAGGTKSGSDVSWEKLSTTTAGKKAQQWKVTATSLPTVYTRVTSGADSLGDDQMETNAEYIYNYLKKKGFTKNAICGILGNMNSESTINPAVWQSLNDMYLGYGLVQWDDGKLFIDWAKKEGVISAATAEAVNSLAYSNPKKLMDAELDYLIVSMNTVGNWFKPDNNQSKYGTSETLTASQFKVSNKSADILARIFCGHYERPGVPKISERVANAKKWYNFL